MYDSDFPEKLINHAINNPKGETPEDRIIDVISDPNNVFISRHPDAGKIEDGLITMHNGIKVHNEYYAAWLSKMLQMNKGVHEPQEERIYQEVLKHILPGGQIVELGAYWAFYSIWFAKVVKRPKILCVEPEEIKIKTGRSNCELNNVRATWFHGKISDKHLTLSQICSAASINHINVLHSDIQGAEYTMLKGAEKMFDRQSIDYIFLGTHSNDLHLKCRSFLEEKGYRILGSADYDNESFCFDGVLVACRADLTEVPYTPLGCRKHTPLRNVPWF